MENFSADRSRRHKIALYKSTKLLLHLRTIEQVLNSIVSFQKPIPSTCITVTAMPTTEYALLFDEAVYANIVPHGYDSSWWMAMQSVHAKATRMPRSKKKLDELCRKEAVLEDDTLTMTKIGTDGVAVSFSAKVGKRSSVLPAKANTGYRCFIDHVI